MAITLTIHQETSIEGPEIYRVDNQVTAATDMSEHVFVFTVEDVFSHVAYPYDMITWPETKAAAITAGLGFYRSTAVVKDYETVPEASDFAVHSLLRADNLVKGLIALEDGFVHEVDHVSDGA